MRLRRPIVYMSAAAALVAGSAIAAAAAPLASPASTPVAGPWSLAPGEYYTELSASTFTTASGFDETGHRTESSVLQQQRVLNSYTELGWKKRASVQFSLPMVTQTYRPAAGTPLSVSGLGDFGFGLRYRIRNGNGASAIQLRWEGPTGYNAKLYPTVGDGLQKLSAALELGGRAGHAAFWQLGYGYRYDYKTIIAHKIPGKSVDPAGPADFNWAEHTTLNAAYAVWFKRLQVAGLYGAEFPWRTGRAYTTRAQAAGPRLAYRVDERLDAFAGSWHTPAGRNALHLDEFYAGIAWKSSKLNRLQGFLGGDKRP